MRIAFFGNTCNNLYQIAKALRQQSSYDAHLYLDNKSDPQTLPESDDPELAMGYPDWIHKGPYVGMHTLLAPWTSPLIRELNQYDLVILSGYGPMLGQFVRRPKMFLVTGGDLTVWPFPFKYQSFYNTWPKKIGQVIRGAWQRRGIRLCDEIWTQPFAPFIQALENLRVESRRISNRYFPLILDSDKFRFIPEARQSAMPAIQQIQQKFDFTVFCPSRLMMNANELMRATGNWKANELLFTGFANFLQRTGAERAGIVLVDRPASQDSQRGRRLIADLGLQDNVLWIKPPREFGFSRDELVPIYSVCDVVADDFGVGWFGCVVLEGLAINKPVVSYVDQAAMRQLYDWHPILSHRTPETIGECLAQLWKSPELRDQHGEKGRRWIEQNHSFAGASKIYVERIDELTSRVKVSEPVP